MCITLYYTAVAALVILRGQSLSKVVYEILKFDFKSFNAWDNPHVALERHQLLTKHAEF